MLKTHIGHAGSERGFCMKLIRPSRERSPICLNTKLLMLSNSGCKGLKLYGQIVLFSSPSCLGFTMYSIDGQYHYDMYSRIDDQSAILVTGKILHIPSCRSAELLLKSLHTQKTSP